MEKQPCPLSSGDDTDPLAKLPFWPPEPGSKPALILEAAGTLFLETGYGAVSMDAVARTANVSKATLYAYFRSKEELFAAMINCECRRHLGDLECEGFARMDIADALRHLGRLFIRLLFSPRALAVYRVAVGESHRFPELAKAFYNAGPSRWVDGMTALMAEADRSGKLRLSNPKLAAEQFLGMVRSHRHMRIVTGLEPVPSEEEMDAIVDSAVSVFCRGYAP